MMVSSFVLVCLLFAVGDSASVHRISERDLQVSERVARARVSFSKDFGDSNLSGHYNTDDDSAGLAGHHKSGNGEFGGNVDVDKDGHLSGGLSGGYSWNGGKTRLGGNLNVGADGKPQGGFSFNHQW